MTGTGRRIVCLCMLALVIAGYLAPDRVHARADGTVTAPARSTPGLLLETGEQIFRSVCIACHSPGREDVDGVFPALAGNALVVLDDPRSVTLAVLYGRGGMPRFGSLLTDEQLSAVITYIRTDLEGNHASPVTPGYVNQIRIETESTPPGKLVSAPTGSPQPELPGN